MYVDMKVTVWQRAYISPGCEERALKLAKQFSPSLSVLWDEEVVDDLTTLDNTEEGIEVAENDNQSTVEVYGDDRVLIWENAPSK
jgi:hypothetical protein